MGLIGAGASYSFPWTVWVKHHPLLGAVCAQSVFLSVQCNQTSRGKISTKNEVTKHTFSTQNREIPSASQTFRLPGISSSQNALCAPQSGIADVHHLDVLLAKLAELGLRPAFRLIQ
jgi:hypothetical protein